MEHSDHHHHSHNEQKPAQENHSGKITSGVHDTHAEHDKHAGHHTEDFLKRFWICLGLTVPVVLLSEMIQHWFGFRISFQGDKYLLLVLGTIIYFYGGMPF